MANGASCDIKQYLNEAFKLLSDFSWIYEQKNVDIFVHNVLEKIPCEWIDHLRNLDIGDLHNIPLGFYKDEWSETLKAFLQTANKNGEFRHSWKFHEFTLKDIEVPSFIAKSTPAKKLQEIKAMAALIGYFALKYNCGVILDVGSGLGYLDQVLHHNFGLMTIGLESVKERSSQAMSRVKNSICNKNMRHVVCNFEDSNECASLVKQEILALDTFSHCECGRFEISLDENSLKNVIMIGLHSCGNLMQDMMKLFCKIHYFKLFIAAGCCYHKIPLKDFPMSCVAKSLLSSNNVGWKPSVTGLRLGCQMTRSSWCSMSFEDHVQQEKCLFFRAVFQFFLQKKGLTWKKPKRHLRKDGDMHSVESFASVAFQNFPWSDEEKASYLEELKEISKEKDHLFHCIRILDVNFMFFSLYVKC